MTTTVDYVPRIFAFLVFGQIIFSFNSMVFLSQDLGVVSGIKTSARNHQPCKFVLVYSYSSIYLTENSCQFFSRRQALHRMGIDRNFLAAYESFAAHFSSDHLSPLV